MEPASVEAAAVTVPAALAAEGGSRRPAATMSGSEGGMGSTGYWLLLVALPMDTNCRAGAAMLEEDEAPGAAAGAAMAEAGEAPTAGAVGRCRQLRDAWRPGARLTARMSAADAACATPCAFWPHTLMRCMLAARLRMLAMLARLTMACLLLLLGRSVSVVEGGREDPVPKLPGSVGAAPTPLADPGRPDPPSASPLVPAGPVAPDCTCWMEAEVDTRLGCPMDGRVCSSSCPVLSMPGDDQPPAPAVTAGPVVEAELGCLGPEWELRSGEPPAMMLPGPPPPSAPAADREGRADSASSGTSGSSAPCGGSEVAMGSSRGSKNSSLSSSSSSHSGGGAHLRPSMAAGAVDGSGFGGVWYAVHKPLGTAAVAGCSRAEGQKQWGARGAAAALPPGHNHHHSQVGVQIADALAEHAARGPQPLHPAQQAAGGLGHLHVVGLAGLLCARCRVDGAAKHGPPSGAGNRGRSKSAHGQEGMSKSGSWPAVWPLDVSMMEQPKLGKPADKHSRTTYLGSLVPRSPDTHGPVWMPTRMDTGCPLWGMRTCRRSSGAGPLSRELGF